jgi:hypothetical protein
VLEIIRTIIGYSRFFQSIDYYSLAVIFLFRDVLAGNISKALRALFSGRHNRLRINKNISDTAKKIYKLKKMSYGVPDIAFMKWHNEFI